MIVVGLWCYCGGITGTWLTHIRPILIDEFGHAAIERNEEYIYELLSSLHTAFSAEQARLKEGAPTKEESAALQPAKNALLVAAQEGWDVEKKRRRMEAQAQLDQFDALKTKTLAHKLQLMQSFRDGTGSGSADTKPPPEISMGRVTKDRKLSLSAAQAAWVAEKTRLASDGEGSGGEALSTAAALTAAAASADGRDSPSMTVHGSVELSLKAAEGAWVAEKVRQQGIASQPKTQKGMQYARAPGGRVIKPKRQEQPTAFVPLEEDFGSTFSL